jgi:hypothetical protein
MYKSQLEQICASRLWRYAKALGRVAHFLRVIR